MNILEIIRNSRNIIKKNYIIDKQKKRAQGPLLFSVYFYLFTDMFMILVSPLLNLKIYLMEIFVTFLAIIKMLNCLRN